MTDQKRVHEGKVLPPAVDRVSAADALGAFNQIVGFLREAIQIHETESTKREKLKTYRDPGREDQSIRESPSVLPGPDLPVAGFQS